MAAWMPSPMPGREQHHAWCRPARRPRPRTGRRRRSRPARRRSRPRRAPGAPAGSPTASPPRWPRVAIERMKTPGSVACSCIRTRSPSSAPPENGEDGSTASTPTRLPGRAQRRDQRGRRWSTCPTPGEPVSPTTCARPVCGASAAVTSRSCGARVLDQRDQPGDRPRPALRAPASDQRRRRPPSRRALAFTGVGCRHGHRPGHPHDQRVALAAAAAQRGRADAAAAALQLQRQVQHDAGRRTCRSGGRARSRRR